MNTATSTITAFAPAQRTGARWSARILTALVALFLTLDGAMKLLSHPAAIEGSVSVGIPGHLAPVIGAILLACVALYLVPRTAVVGAILLTGYLGGAVLVHLRLGAPLATHTLFPVYVGAIAWLGLYLRDERVRALLANSTRRG